MKKILLLVFGLILINIASIAATGWFEDYVIVNPNNSGSGHYWIGANPGFGTQLQGHNFGIVSSLVITGADMKYWSDTKDRTGGAFYYLIKSADGNTIHVPATEVIWTQSGPNGNNYQGLWTGTINLISTLSPSTSYQLHIYAKHWGTGQGDNWLSNGGANYVATFTTVAAPVAYNVTGTGSYCFGNAGLAVGLANSETGVTYTLYKGAEAQTPTINGTTGDAITFGIQIAGTYTVKGTRSVFTTDMEGSAVITENALPAAVTVSGAGTFCSTATITASNGGGGTIYFQGTTSGGTSTAAASTSQVITTSGTYYFRALSAGGCWGTEGSAVVTINTPVTPTVSITVLPNPIVSGMSTTITATPSYEGDAPSYSFYINDVLAKTQSSPTYTFAPLAGTYLIHVIMTSNLGCVTSSTATSETVTLTVTTSPPTTKWTGADDNNWHNILNWTSGVPGSISVVTIPSEGITNFPTLSSLAICKNLIMESGASILGNNYLFFSSGGSATVKRTISEGVWHLVSSPVIGATAGIFLHDYLQS